jgi:hypothetical protein
MDDLIEPTTINTTNLTRREWLPDMLGAGSVVALGKCTSLFAQVPTRPSIASPTAEAKKARQFLAELTNQAG